MSYRITAVGVLALSIAASASAQETMYVLGGNINPQLLTLDKVTGGIQTAVSVTGSEALFGGLASNAAGDTLYSIDGFNDPNPDRFFKISPGTGAGSVVGPTGQNWNFRNVFRNPVDGKVYASRDNTLFSVDENTGAVTQIANITGPTLDQMTTLAINPAGVCFGVDIQDVGLFQVNLTTGAATHIGNLTPGGGFPQTYYDIDFDMSGTLYGVQTFNGVYTINTTTAQATLAYNGIYTGIAFAYPAGGGGCYADCDLSGSLDFFDFLCFQNEFAVGTAYADCDESGSLDFFDFLCFQNEFATGCP